ncbi:MAG: hypothetical protein IIZ38_05125 [Sphingomonas sp.]|uniref:hypothetical protein n=1 Tax=Sphingomonas sp. TaxID=28214 RepID=UPI0025D25DE6|nr:hypothetical protein [Sphingomonas sp.]MBQ1497678.1 hypothetical protein [Sphingomonas sp.]MBQ8102768.1 hypothetical protein [Afipia sp.]
MRAFFGSIAVAAKKVRAKVWTLKAHSVDNVENLGPALDVEPMTVTTSEWRRG